MKKVEGSDSLFSLYVNIKYFAFDKSILLNSKMFYENALKHTDNASKICTQMSQYFIRKDKSIYMYPTMQTFLMINHP